MATNVQTYLSLLGKKVEDRITGFAGVCASVTFDLYGCVQGIVNPGMDKEGKMKESQWFDSLQVEGVGRPACNDPTYVRLRFGSECTSTRQRISRTPFFHV